MIQFPQRLRMFLESIGAVFVQDQILGDQESHLQVLGTGLLTFSGHRSLCGLTTCLVVSTLTLHQSVSCCTSSLNADSSFVLIRKNVAHFLY